MNPCHHWNKFSHWSNEHNVDGWLSLELCATTHLKVRKPHFTEIVTIISAIRLRNPMFKRSKSWAVLHRLAKKLRHRQWRLLWVFTIIVCTLSPARTACASDLGPLVDDGAPSCAVGNEELQRLRNLLFSSRLVLDDKPYKLAAFDYCQFAAGSYACPPRSITGLAVLHFTSSCLASVAIRHLPIEDSSLWVPGRNLTRRWNLMRIKRHALDFSVTSSHALDMSTVVSTFTLVSPTSFHRVQNQYHP